MKCQVLFPEKKGRIIINLSSADLAQRVVKVNVIIRHGRLFALRKHAYSNI